MAVYGPCLIGSDYILIWWLLKNTKRGLCCANAVSKSGYVSIYRRNKTTVNKWIHRFSIKSTKSLKSQLDCTGLDLSEWHCIITALHSAKMSQYSQTLKTSTFCFTTVLLVNTHKVKNFGPNSENKSSLRHGPGGYTFTAFWLDTISS